MVEDHYVDPDGIPITFEEWMQLLAVDKISRIIAEDTLPDGRLLRTVWIGTEFLSIGIRAFGTAIMTAEGKAIVEIGQYSERDIAERCHQVHLEQISASTLDLVREAEKETTEGPEAAR